MNQLLHLNGGGMRFLILLLYTGLVCGAWFRGIVSEAAEGQIDSALLVEAANLVAGYLRDDPIAKKLAIIGQSGDRARIKREQPKVELEYQRRLYHRISTRPGLKPYIFHLLKFPREKTPENVIAPLVALASRVDLLSEDVAVVRAQMIEILDHPAPDEIPQTMALGLQLAFLAGGAGVLGREVTPENEAVLRRCLTWPNGRINAAVAKAWRENGVVENIPAVEGAMWKAILMYDTYHERAIRKDLLALKQQAAQRRTSKKPRPTGLRPPMTPVFVKKDPFPANIE